MKLMIELGRVQIGSEPERKVKTLEVGSLRLQIVWVMGGDPKSKEERRGEIGVG